MKNIQHDEPFEVNEKQYNAIMSQLAGVCAGQIRNGKFFLQLWLKSYKTQVNILLTKHK